MSSNQQIAGLKFVLSANDQKFAQQMKGVRKDIAGVKEGFMEVAGALGVAFGAHQIASFAFETAKLAGEARGVRAAFDRLNNSKQLLIDLKEATHGTVSELELMKRTVMASNFKINIEALPKLLEFAALRAQQTGQSVDYLVDSIVTGIGRKSALILDNLGISAAELREQLKETPDYAQAVAAIIEREMPKMGTFIETAASSSEKLSSAWEDFKIQLGETIQSRATNFIDSLTDSVNALTEAAKSPALNAFLRALSIIGGPTESMEGFGDVKNKGLFGLGLFANPDKQQRDFSKDPNLFGKINHPAWLTETMTPEEAKEIQKKLQEKRMAAFKEKLAGLSSSDESFDDTPLNFSGFFGGTGGFDLAEDNKRMADEMASAYEDSFSRIVAAAEQAKEAQETHRMSVMDTANAAMALGENIGQVFGDLASGTINAAQALGQAAAQMVRHIGKVIMAEMVLAAIKDKATGFNFFAKLALVGVAFSAGAAILSKLGASGGGGGISSQGGGSQRNIDKGIYVQGKFSLQGSTLVAGIDKAEYNKSRLG